VILTELGSRARSRFEDRLVATKSANTARQNGATMRAVSGLLNGRYLRKSFEGMASKINVPESEEDGIDPFDRAEIAAIVQGFESTDIQALHAFCQISIYDWCRTSEAVGLQWKRQRGPSYSV